MKTRLQKIIAGAGLASRRDAEKIILSGRVTINGIRTVEMGVQADPERDEIRLDGCLVGTAAQKVYILLNKPRGYITTLADPQQRPVVTDLLSGLQERVFPIGRLDYDSEGLLLLTNDGQFANRVQHPRYRVAKTYRVKVEGHLTIREMRALSDGVMLEDGMFKPLQAVYERKNTKSCWIVMTVSEGRNRIIRRALAALGHPVTRLIRIAMADVPMGDLRPGEYRHLTKKELSRLWTASR
jgi:23S rRNA pseudouridine2605 synthase